MAAANDREPRVLIADDLIRVVVTGVGDTDWIMEQATYDALGDKCWTKYTPGFFSAADQLVGLVKKHRCKGVDAIQRK